MASKEITSLSKEEFQNFMDSIDIILSDCDGVLWRETEVIQGSPEAVNKFKQLGKKFFYITNNNTKTRSEFVVKCKNLKYEAALEDIVCTSFLAAVYLKEKKFDKRVYVIGSEGIIKELEAEGIKHCGIGPDIMDGDELEMVVNFKPDPEIGAIVVGFDKHFSFPKLVKAATYLKDPNVHFVGTNCDTERPSPNDNKFPGTGCFIKTIEAASSRKAVMLGKPEPFLIEYISKKFGLNPQRTLMIGDNLTTDILFGKRCGFKTLLVLSGITSKDDVNAMNASNPDYKDLAVPDYYINQLGDVLKMVSS
ncbi:glycerol-3-phosphate phosphatase-like [Calliopsis andreniformis]|uniref:glycerol-3-phosphate phosphatase-like n=1 Tax=Calliopsis andreniformis TaxID=337506 RepID=UPI003FCD4A06